MYQTETKEMEKIKMQENNTTINEIKENIVTEETTMNEHNVTNKEINETAIMEETTMNNQNNTNAVDTTATANPVATANSLPTGYGQGGFMERDSKGNLILKREYVNKYAREIAEKLVNGTPPMSAAAFNKNFSGEANKKLKRTISTEARLLCADSMLSKAKQLTNRKKAPKILRDMMDALIPYVIDDDSFKGLCTHLGAVYSEMLDIEAERG